MFDKNKEFKYDVDPKFDFVLEERANTYIAARKIRWGETGDYKVDIRKYRATEEGEMMMKGCSLTDEGTNELTKILLQEGYGKDKEIFETIIDNRPELTSRFIQKVQESSDKEIEEHLSKFPVEDEKEEELYNLDDVI